VVRCIIFGRQDVTAVIYYQIILPLSENTVGWSGHDYPSPFYGFDLRMHGYLIYINKDTRDLLPRYIYNEGPLSWYIIRDTTGHHMSFI
jgi:hypothetical protein